MSGVSLDTKRSLGEGIAFKGQGLEEGTEELSPATIVGATLAAEDAISAYEVLGEDLSGFT